MTDYCYALHEQAVTYLNELLGFEAIHFRHCVRHIPGAIEFRIMSDDPSKCVQDVQDALRRRLGEPKQHATSQLCPSFESMWVLSETRKIRLGFYPSSGLLIRLIDIGISLADEEMRKDDEDLG